MYMNSPNQSTAVVILDRDLTPATRDQIKRELGVLLAAFPAADNGDGAARITAYVMALEDEPAWAISKAVKAFIRGEIERQTHAFLPTPAEVKRVAASKSEWARKEFEREVQTEHRRRQAERDRKSDNSGPLSDETRAYAKAALERMRASAEAERESLSRKVGPDLSQYYKHKPDSYDGRPLTAEDLKNIPDRKPSKTGLQHVSGYNPLPGNGGRRS